MAASAVMVVTNTINFNFFCFLVSIKKVLTKIFPALSNLDKVHHDLWSAGSLFHKSKHWSVYYW